MWCACVVYVDIYIGYLHECACGMYVYLGGYVHVDMNMYSCGVFCMNDGSIHDFMCMHDYWGMPMWGWG